MEQPDQQNIVSRLVSLMAKSPQTFLYRKRNGQMRRGHGTLQYDVIKNHLGNGTRKRPETATAYWDFDKNEWRSFRNLHLSSIFEYYPVFRYSTNGYGIVDYNGNILAPLVKTTTLSMLGQGFLSKYIAQNGYRKAQSKVFEISRNLREREGQKNLDVKPTMSIMTSSQILRLVQRFNA